MRSRFLIEDFEPLNMEKAQKKLDKRIDNARDSLESMRAQKELERFEASLWGTLTHWLKKVFARKK